MILLFAVAGAATVTVPRYVPGESVLGLTEIVRFWGVVPAFGETDSHDPPVEADAAAVNDKT